MPDFIYKIKDEMIKIKHLIKNEKFNEAYEIYNKTDIELQQSDILMLAQDSDKKEILSEFYAEYAYFLFGFEEYENFFDKYIMAQNYGYSPENRREFIYESFVYPNLTELKLNYDSNMKEFLKYNNLNKDFEFEELDFWPVTTGKENEYYIYDKKRNRLKNKIENNLATVLKGDSFNGVIASDENLESIKLLIEKDELYYGNIYIVNSNISKLLLLFQLQLIKKEYISRLFVFESVSSFEKYIIDSNNYLPRYFLGDDEDIEKIKKRIKVIHKNRTREKRNFRENILLSICIPSFNRGKRAYENILNLINSEFDQEIEFVVSNNGTKNNTIEYYEKIKSIKDSRLIYFEFEENQGVSLNFCKVVDLANGKFVLLLSDEDMIDLNKLKELISIIKSIENEISIIRVKSDNQTIPYVGRAIKGTDAFKKFQLSSNYMSGNIYNRAIIAENKLTNYISSNLDNEACLYYPHMVWDIFLFQYGDVLGIDLSLVKIGAVEKTDLEIQKNSDNSKTIPYYATIDGRLNQHRGFFEIMGSLDIVKKDRVFFRELYIMLSEKTILLIALSIKEYYTEKDVNNIIKKTKYLILKHLKNVHLSNNNLEFNEDFLYLSSLIENVLNCI